MAICRIIIRYGVGRRFIALYLLQQKGDARMYRFGLIGETLSHSFSPKLHNKMMKKNQIEGSFELIEIPQAEFPQRFQQLLKEGYHGLNVTFPYKEAVIPFLDRLSPQAKYIGAVNTIVFEHGSTVGYNTDYVGFQELLKKNHIPVKGKEAILLGAGGAAKAVTKALIDLGIFDLTIVSRGKQSFHGQYTVSYDFFKEDLVSCDILINCTPVGMYPDVNVSILPKEAIHTEYAIDLIYNPAKTLFLKYAAENGAKVYNGKYMLYQQAAKAEELWLERN